ncbi:oxygenase MpaB family protein [Nocardia asiatica]|uniref:oxygenase MpaB family protein n=1 Tax=Nocardia asiatica TaxID=209252 RepID=UPI0002F2F4BB|nr:oxygenase MpaB family protein [Nocardia asiatica]
MTASVARESTGARTLPPRRPIEPGTQMWDQTGLVTFSLTAGSAFLLQTMEPTISAVVDEYSTFRTDPMGRAMRSLASVMMWVYGGEEALAEADRLRELHASLNTTDADGVRHTALSSGPWAWVLHTGTFAFTESAKYFAKRPLTEADKEAYFQETLQLLRNFSVAPKEIPANYAEFEKFFDDTVANHLVATDTARDYLRVIRSVAPPKHLPRALRPAWKAAVAPIGWLQYFVTVGTTPEVARQKLGLTWTEADQRKLRVIGWLIARLVPLLPERLRYFPIAYEARRLERDRQRLRKMIDLRPI